MNGHPTLLGAGVRAPDFTLRATPGQTVSLSEFRGKPVILAFYPADWSPVCGAYRASDGTTERALFYFHVQPFNPPEGLNGPEKFPAVCSDTTGTTYYNVKDWGGPSDWDWQVSVDQGKPEYIIDKKRIYVTDPSVTDKTKWANSTKRYDWNTRKCKW